MNLIDYLVPALAFVGAVLFALVHLYRERCWRLSLRNARLGAVVHQLQRCAACGELATWVADPLYDAPIAPCCDAHRPPDKMIAGRLVAPVREVLHARAVRDLRAGDLPRLKAPPSGRSQSKLHRVEALKPWTSLTLPKAIGEAFVRDVERYAPPSEGNAFFKPEWVERARTNTTAPYVLTERGLERNPQARPPLPKANLDEDDDTAVMEPPTSRSDIRAAVTKISARGAIKVPLVGPPKGGAS